MSTALATQNTSIKAHTKEERYFTEEQMKLLSDHIMKGASPIELQYFGEVCKRVGLDPFKKQIHAVQRWDNDLKRYVWSYQTGIDGYRSIAASTGCFAGCDEPKFIPADESAPNPRKATVTVWKLVGGMRVPFTASARWEEYVQVKKDGTPNSMWRKMPYSQLGKCAEALALRKAFPERIDASVLTDVEMEQADSETERQGPKPAGRPGTGFDLESKPFEATPEPAANAAETPSSPAAQATVVEAEVVTEREAIAVPQEVAAWTGGKWKEAMGADNKPKELADKRTAALSGDDATAAYQALASIYDEVQARLTSKKVTEADFADMVCANGLEGIEWPADLWSKLPRYPQILQIAKSIK